MIPGLAWIGSVKDKAGQLVGGSQKLIVALRVIRRGRNKDMLEVVEPMYDGKGNGTWTMGKKHIIGRRSVIRHPESEDEDMGENLA